MKWISHGAHMPDTQVEELEVPGWWWSCFEGSLWPTFVCPLKMGRNPKGNDRLPTGDMLVFGRVLWISCLGSVTMKVSSFAVMITVEEGVLPLSRNFVQEKIYSTTGIYCTPFTLLPYYCWNWKPLDSQHLGPTARMLWSAEFHWRKTSPIGWGWNGS